MEYYFYDLFLLLFSTLGHCQGKKFCKEKKELFFRKFLKVSFRKLKIVF